MGASPIGEMSSCVISHVPSVFAVSLIFSQLVFDALLEDEDPLADVPLVEEPLAPSFLLIPFSSA